jgi:hypothetical protein
MVVSVEGWGRVGPDFQRNAHASSNRVCRRIQVLVLQGFFILAAGKVRTVRRNGSVGAVWPADEQT